MAIQYNSIQDPFNLLGASSLLAQVISNKDMERMQQANALARLAQQNQYQMDAEQRSETAQIEKEKRTQALQRQFGPILGKTLSIMNDPSVSLAERLKAGETYVAQTGDVTSIKDSYKAITQQANLQNELQKYGLNISPQVNTQTAPQSPLFDTTTNSIGSFVQQNTPRGVTDTETIQTNVTQASPNTQQSSSPFQSLPDNALNAMLLSPIAEIRNAGKAEIDRRKTVFDQNLSSEKFKFQKFSDERKFQTEQAKPIVDQVEKNRFNLRIKESAYENINNAVESGETGATSINTIAQATGISQLLNQKGAQLVAAGKEYLLSNISRAGARPNQWLEQQIAAAIAGLGKTDYANASMALLMKEELLLSRKYEEIYDQIAEQDRQKFGFVKGDTLGKRVSQAFDKYVEKVQMRTAYKLREINEQEKGINTLRKSVNKEKVPQGTPLTKQMAAIFLEKYGDVDTAITNAKKLGYTIYSQQDIEEINNL